MGQNNITVKHLRQQRFLLSRNSCGNMLVYMCVLCEVLLHPPQVSRYGEDATFTRARSLRPASPNLLFANPRENTLGGYDTKTDRQCKQCHNLSLFPLNSAMPDDFLIPASMPLLPFSSVTAIIVGMTLLRAVEPLTC